MITTNRLSYLLPLLALLALPSAAWSQVSFGLSGGFASSNVYGDDVDDDATDSRTGALGGAFLTFPVGGIISLTTGAYYVQKGVTDNTVGEEAEIEVDYLEIPLLVNVEVTGRERASFSLFAGPQVSFETTCDAVGAVDCEGTESTQFGAIFGGGFRFMSSDTMFFLVNGGLDLGLSDVVDTEDVKHSTWFAQAGVGWTLGG